MYTEPQCCRESDLKLLPSVEGKDALGPDHFPQEDLNECSPPSALFQSQKIRQGSSSAVDLADLRPFTAKNAKSPLQKVSPTPSNEAMTILSSR